MRSSINKRIEHVIGKEITSRALREYMDYKGFKNMNMLVYPPAINDIGLQPDTFKKIELIPHQHESDPTTNAVVVGWNLFVLGTNRLYLGTTTHTSLAELASGGITEHQDARLEKTANDIIEFIIKILDGNEEGFQRKPMDGAAQPGLPTNKPRIGPTQSGGYYERNKIV